MLLLEQPVQDTFPSAPAPPDKLSLHSKHLERRPSWLVYCHLPASELELETESKVFDSLNFQRVVGGRPLQLPLHQNTELIYQLKIKVHTRGDVHCTARTAFGESIRE